MTGSARLNTFKKAGDSLAGRHFLVRLLPLSVKELAPADSDQAQAICERLLQFGGFPEPYLTADPTEYALWQRAHLDVILRQDLLDLENVRSVKQIETLVTLLQERVGSGISYQGLSEDLQVSPKTIKHWISILENLYILFQVYPYHQNIAKAIKKEPKIYFFDYGRLKDPEARLENLMACHLLKRNYFLEDTQGQGVGLFYLRDKQRHEVDFVLTQDGTITHLIEVKNRDDKASPSLKFFQERLKPPRAIRAVMYLERENFPGPFEVLRMSHFLSSLEA